MTLVDVASTGNSTLIRARLSGWSLAAIAAGAVAVTMVLFAATPMQGRVAFLLVGGGHSMWWRRRPFRRWSKAGAGPKTDW